MVCLVGIVLAFIVQFAGFNGEAKEKMHRFQTAQENMNSASVEYVRGMPEIKAFNQTADSFKRLSKSIKDYTSFVLEYALGWQNCMPCIYHNHQQYLSVFNSGRCSDRDAYYGFQRVFVDIHFLPDYCTCDFRYPE